MPQRDTTALESRLTDLEIKASFTEDLLDELNLVIYRQREQLDRLALQVHQLRLQMPEGRGPGGSGGTEGGDARNELPPHY